MTFGLFDTLVTVEPRVDRPVEPMGEADWDPASALATELSARGVAVPDDWPAAYAETHLDPPPLAGVPLPAHVAGPASRSPHTSRPPSGVEASSSPTTPSGGRSSRRSTRR